MIGASIELYRATADEQYLTNAQRITSFVAFHETVSTAYGKCSTMARARAAREIVRLSKGLRFAT
jgi:hypothetical protein